MEMEIYFDENEMRKMNKISQIWSKFQFSIILSHFYKIIWTNYTHLHC